MPTPLDLLIRAFEARLDEFRSRYGSTWAVFHADEIAGVFREFGEAAEFAYQRFGDDDYLIRHTYQTPEFAPFLLVDCA